MLARVRDWAENDPGCGGSSPASFARFDPDTCSWKTWGHCLLGGLIPFSGRWPHSGTMRNGIAYRLPPLVPRISGTGCLFWRTPQAQEAGARIECRNLNDEVKMFPTPRVQSSRGTGPSRTGNKVDLQTVVGGQLNPTWVEWLMGFPTGWTDLDASATP